MQGESDANHAAIAAWLDGTLTPAERQEFEAHLATCSECQERVALMLKAKIAEVKEATVSIKPELPPQPPPEPSPRLWVIVCFTLLVVAVLAIGYALGSWAWDLAHR